MEATNPPTPKTYIVLNVEKTNEVLGEKKRNFPDHRGGKVRH